MFNFDNFEFSTRWIISQALGVLLLTGVFLVFQVKGKKKLIFFFGAYNFFATFMYFFIGDTVMMGISAIGVVRNIAFFWVETRREKIKPTYERSILIFFLCLSVSSMALTWDGEFWFEWVLLAGSLCANYGTWAKGPHRIRIGNIIYSVCIIIQSIRFLNIANILIETTVILSCIVFYFRFFHARRKKQETLALKTVGTFEDEVNTNAQLVEETPIFRALVKLRKKKEELENGVVNEIE